MSHAVRGDVDLLAALPADDACIGDGRVRSVADMVPEPYSALVGLLRTAGQLTGGGARRSSIAFTARGRAPQGGWRRCRELLRLVPYRIASA